MSNLLALDAATDPSICGHKAATLASLRTHGGFDIPDGFVIPAGVQATREEIAAALSRLGEGAFAVRSSGLAEDLPDASFAGQYDTLLHVRGTDAVLEAAARVAASSDGRVTSYGQAARPIAVLVQQMIEPEVAGVAFSVNPLTGNANEVRVSAAPGVGEKLVSGAIDADEWLVTLEGATACALPHNAMGPELASAVAALARKAEEARRAPQDIEWAMSAGRLWLLQSRPITALPLAPEIDRPKGTWQKDAGHFPDPITPFAASTQFHHGDKLLDRVIATWGLLPDAMHFRIIGHEPYLHVEPDDGGKAPPPWWLLGILARVVPSMRRKLAASAYAIRSGWLETMPAEWETVHRPRLRSEIARLAAIDLASMDESELFRHVDKLRTFYADCLQLHFSLAVPNAVGIYELAQTCDELLNWDLQKSVGLLQGLSNTSTAPSDELAALVRKGCQRNEIRALLEARDAGVLERLEEIDASFAGELRAYLRFWGLRPLGPEPGSPSFGEQRQLVADVMADLILNDRPGDVATRRLALVDEARAQLTGTARERFDAALAYAERVYPLREDNVLLTDHLPVGLLRRVALEAGRRLTAMQLMARAEDAVMLTAEELREALRSREDVHRLVSQRKREHAWVRANPGPMTYGPAPGASPDLRGLPEPSRRINRALLWMLDQEFMHAPRGDGDAIVGIGVSPGIHRGRVRVIHSPAKLDTLRSGEVLVCPMTSAAWMMVFRRAGAIVADTGSLLSHTAIVAREFALPAVVATANGSSRLVDGEEVIVDGARGVVTRC